MAMFPPRCFSCGKPLVRFDVYQEAFERLQDKSKALDEMNIKKTCCRRMYYGHIPEIEDNLLKYNTKYRGGDGRTS